MKHHPRRAIDAALKPFVTHASKFGTDSLYEVAESELSPLDLAILVGELRAIDKHWRLDPSQRVKLVDELTSLGKPDKEIRQLLGITQPTLRKDRQTHEERRKASLAPREARTRPPSKSRLSSAAEAVSFTSEFHKDES